MSIQSLRKRRRPTDRHDLVSISELRGAAWPAGRQLYARQELERAVHRRPIGECDGARVEVNDMSDDERVEFFTIVRSRCRGERILVSGQLLRDMRKLPTRLYLEHSGETYSFDVKSWRWPELGNDMHSLVLALSPDANQLCPGRSLLVDPKDLESELISS